MKAVVSPDGITDRPTPKNYYSLLGDIIDIISYV
jgi:hypothetical protein